VVAQAKRRRYTAEYKESILAEADQARGSGGIGAPGLGFAVFAFGEAMAAITS
jgi:hypothetical protein